MSREALAESLRWQAGWCGKLGSPLYHSLLTSAAEDVQSGGVCWEFLEPFAGESGRTLPLRFVAMLHRRALEGHWPELACYYPSCGGTADPERAWAEIRRGLNANAKDLRRQIPVTIQTNEVARCAALLPGFLRIARQTRLPIRLLELGASAGLNLRWDQYRYEVGGASWGGREAPVIFRNSFAGEPKFAADPVHIVSRRGCDLHPIPTTPEGLSSLLSFLWPDQLDRIDVMKRAFEVAQRIPAPVDAADAAEWTAQQLRELPAGAATVVFHSIFWLYLSPEARLRIDSILKEAGSRADARSPLAWLRMEAGEAETAVHLTLWPGGETVLLARSGFHGRNVELCQ